MQPPVTNPKHLVQQVRAGFILRGTTMSAWARQNGLDPSTVRQALYGTWNGPKGRAVRAKVLKAAGVQERAA
jgi:gp16 family phage-associated protein